MDADKIVVLKRGKIREIGTHQELLQIQNGLYRKLVTKQFALDESSRMGSMQNSLESSMENITRVDTVSNLTF